jgi:hypothetical protein
MRIENRLHLLTMSNKKIIHLGMMDKFFILFIRYLLNTDMLGIIPLYLLYYLQYFLHLEAELEQEDFFYLQLILIRCQLLN